MTLLDAPTREMADGSTLELVPRLENGDRLGGAEFMRRYEAMPGLKAELVHGVVYMGSPVSLIQHADPHHLLGTWLGVYRARNPRLIGGTDATVILADNQRLQPDLVLMLPPERSGKAVIGEDGFIHGPPELVVEIAASTANLDAHAKAEAYHAAGVPEYLLWRTEEHRIDWFARTDDRYIAMDPAADDMLESRLFPGLTLERQALLRGDLATVLQRLSNA